MTNKDSHEHRFVVDTDRCLCGGMWVYWEEEGTHGCEMGPPPPNMRLDYMGRRII